VLQRDTLALIVGAQESFKSFLALSLGMAIATGRGWHGPGGQPGQPPGQPGHM
jgi:RecA-family ATPase